MSMRILRTEDPRDALAKARRLEILAFARLNKVNEIRQDMPADIMRAILRRRGMTNIQIPKRVLGQPEFRGERETIDQGNGLEVEAVDDLMKQYLRQSPQIEEQPKLKKMMKSRHSEWKNKKVGEMQMNEMRRACLFYNLQMSRKDKKPDLASKLKAHGLE